MKADMKSVLTIAVASTLGLAALPAVVSASEYGDVATVIFCHHARRGLFGI